MIVRNRAHASTGALSAVSAIPLALASVNRASAIPRALRTMSEKGSGAYGRGAEQGAGAGRQPSPSAPPNNIHSSKNGPHPILVLGPIYYC